jgi:AcrR family transcriptional regulator
MRQGSGTDGQKRRTFIEAARRAQIVAAAIETIAELGYAQASLARIAERAGISKGVISYHFASKDDLIREVTSDVLAKGEAYMVPRIVAETSGTGILRVYIESNLAFMRDHRSHLVAFLDIFCNARDDEGRPLVEEKALDYMVTSLEQVLAHFQSLGEFRRDFDPHAMAMAIRGAIDQVPPQLTRHPDLDIDAYAAELAALFDRATRS